MTGIEENITKVIKETIRMETDHMTEVKARTEIIREDFRGIEEI